MRVFRLALLFFAVPLASEASFPRPYDCFRFLTRSRYWQERSPGDDRVEWVRASHQLAAVKKVLIEAFGTDDPLLNWFHPSARMQQALMATFVNHAFLNGGIVQVKGGETGAALWFESDRAPTGPVSLLLTGQAFLIPRFGLHAFDLLKFDAKAGKTRKELTETVTPGKSAIYLWYVGVVPEAQGRGFGSALIRPVLDLADSEGRAVVLEVQKRENEALYNDYGFTLTQTWQIPDDAPATTTMVRAPNRP